MITHGYIPVSKSIISENKYLSPKQSERLCVKSIGVKSSRNLVKKPVIPSLDRRGNNRDDQCASPDTTENLNFSIHYQVYNCLSREIEDLLIFC